MIPLLIDTWSWTAGIPVVIGVWLLAMILVMVV
jgi:hypothetical protein